MTDFFKFRNNLEEAIKVKQAKKPSEVYEDELQKPEDDPCWEGYVQVGTKMQDGKEVPNCVPMEEARKQMDEASRKTEKELSKLMTKALDGKRPKSDYTSEIANNGDFVVKDGGGRVVGRIKKGEFENPMKENVNEGYYDYPDYGPVGASEMAQTQLHFIKYAADDITRCLKMGCPMPEWYQNKLAKIEGDMEGLYSYMKGKTRKMKAHHADRYSMGMRMYGEETLTEAKSGDKEAYTKFFNKALKKFGVDSPAELKGDKEKEFYDYVDKNWKADDEEKMSEGKYSKSRAQQAAIAISKKEKNESTINEVLKPSDDVSTWIEDFYKSDAPQFKGKDKEERREMAVAAWLEARREAGYDVDKNPNEE